MPLPRRPPATADPVPAWLAPASVGPARALQPRTTALAPAPPKAPAPVPADGDWHVLASWDVVPPRVHGPALPVRVTGARHGGYDWEVLTDDGEGILARGWEDKARTASRSAHATAAALAPPTHHGPLTTTEAARLLGVTLETVRSWDRRGHLARLDRTAGVRARYRLEELLDAEGRTRATGLIPGRGSRYSGRTHPYRL